MARHRFLIACLVATTASGCATLPVPQTARGVDVDMIVDATKCELGFIMTTDYGRDIQDWSAKVTLDLKVLYDNSGGPSAALVVPYSVGFVDVSGGFTGSAQSNRVGHLSYNVAKLKDLAGAICPPSTGLPFSPAQLGLGNWLVTAVRSVTRGRDYVDLNELSYTLEFVIEQSVSGDVRIRSIGRPTTGSAGIGGRASAKDSNTLLVSLVPPTAGPSESRIRIVNWPRVLTQSSSAATKKSELDKPADPAAVPVQRPVPPRQRIQVQEGQRSRSQRIDPSTQQRLDDLQVKQRLFNSITVPRSTLNAF